MDRQRDRERASRHRSSGNHHRSSSQGQRPKPNNETYNESMFQIHSLDTQLVHAFQAISWKQKCFIELTLFTIASYYGLWSFQFSPTAYNYWKETAMWMTGIQGTPFLLAIAYAVFTSEDLKILLQDLTDGTSLRTTVDAILGLNLQRIISEALFVLFRMLDSYIWSFSWNWNIIIMMISMVAASFCTIVTLIDVFYLLVPSWVSFGDLCAFFCQHWTLVTECMDKLVILCAVLMGVYIGGLLVLGFPMPFLALIVLVLVSLNYSNDVEKYSREAVYTAGSILCGSCTALIWYKLVTCFVISPVVLIVSLVTYITTTSLVTSIVTLGTYILSLVIFCISLAIVLCCVGFVVKLVV